MDENNQPINYRETLVDIMMLINETRTLLNANLCCLTEGYVNDDDMFTQLPEWKRSADVNVSSLARVLQLCWDTWGDMVGDNDLNEDEIDKAVSVPILETPYDEILDEGKPPVTGDSKEYEYRDWLIHSLITLADSMDLISHAMVRLAFAGVMAGLPLELNYRYDYAMFENEGDKELDRTLAIVKKIIETFMKLQNLNNVSLAEMEGHYDSWGRLEAPSFQDYFPDEKEL